MTVMIDIKEQYLDKLEKFIDSLPNDAVVVKSSLTEELDKRVGEYKTGKKKGVSRHLKKFLNLIKFKYKLFKIK